MPACATIRGQRTASRLVCRARAARRPQAGRRLVAAGSSKYAHQLYSELVDQALLLYIFQQDLGTQLQRALNQDQFEVANQIRAKREQVDEAVANHNKNRGAASGTASVDLSETSMDTLSEGLTLQARLNTAVEEEDYAAASELRDRLDALKVANEKAAHERRSELYPDPTIQIGQRVEIKGTELSGVVVGWDRACCEKDKWKEENDVAALSHGERQPFYHVIVDVREWGTVGDPSSRMRHVPCAYIAQEDISCPSLEGKTWIETHADGDRASFAHPYEYLLFLGKDAHGDFIPTAELRSAYGQQRRDVYPVRPGAEGDGSGSDADGSDT